MRIVCQQTIIMKYHALFVIFKKAAKFEIVACCKSSALKIKIPTIAGVYEHDQFHETFYKLGACLFQILNTANAEIRFCMRAVWSTSFHTIEPRHEISNNVVCATTKCLDQLSHTRSLIRAFASRLNSL